MGKQAILEYDNLLNTNKMKSGERKLVWIKLLHIGVWIFFNIVLLYLFYAAITDRTGLWFWLGVGAFFLEFVVLLIYNWNCPITFWARNYSDSQMDNFDIYLPNWLARHNKTIYSILIGILFIIFIYNQFIL
jgi:polyferredoxin